MRNFKHFNADTVANAVSLLAEYGDTAKVITGGVDLVGLLKNRVIELKALVNIKTVPGLDYIREDSGVLSLGALTTISAIEHSSLVKEKYPMLAQAAHAVAAPQLRNMSSLSGNLCQSNRCWYYRRGPDTGLTFFCRLKGGSQCYAASGDNRHHAVINIGKCIAVCPSDMAPALVALDAKARIAGKAGERTVSLEQLYAALPLGKLVEADEIITEIMVPAPGKDTRQRFLKFTLRKSIDFAIVSVALAGSPGGDVSLVLGGVAPAPYRAALAEDVLRGKPVTPELAEEAARAALSKARPLAKNAYKLPIARAIIKRAILV
jgi:xanthine dehydrogenase YagS FAD-binding subunit